MKSLFILILIFFLAGCSLDNECARRGAQWGYLYGILKAKNSAEVHMYSMSGRIVGSKYCR